MNRGLVKSLFYSLFLMIGGIKVFGWEYVPDWFPWFAGVVVLLFVLLSEWWIRK